MKLVLILLFVCGVQCAVRKDKTISEVRKERDGLEAKVRAASAVGPRSR